MKRANPVWTHASSANNQEIKDQLHLFNSYTKQKVSVVLLIII